MIRMILAGLIGWALSSSGTGMVHAQNYPSRPVKLILPYTPGSPNDVIARLAGPHLSTRLGQPVVIDHRPGGGTTIGAKAVVSAEPDGHTLLFTNTPTHVIAPLISKTATFDPLKDFVPVAAIATTFLVMVVPPSIPADSVQELVHYAKTNPGKLNFGFGQGTLPHLVGELFKMETGADFVSIPYKGGAQAIADMLGGRIDLNFGTTATLAPLIRAGKLKALAVTGIARSADLPDVPTMIESGLANVTTLTYYGLLAPSGTPPDVIGKLNGAINESLRSSELLSAMSKSGFGLKSGSPKEFAALIAEQAVRWGPIVKNLAFQME